MTQSRDLEEFKTRSEPLIRNKRFINASKIN